MIEDETIRALTNMRDCGLIAISTPLGPDNFISILIDMKNEDGTDFYNVMVGKKLIIIQLRHH